jgi:hypothetical protein
VQIFFPYKYFVSENKNVNAQFQFGIHYVYEQNDEVQIYGEITRIHDLGFKVIRIPLECNPYDYNHTQNRKTEAFLSAAYSYGLAVALVIRNLDLADRVNYYLDF